MQEIEDDDSDQLPPLEPDPAYAEDDDEEEEVVMEPMSIEEEEQEWEDNEDEADEPEPADAPEQSNDNGGGRNRRRPREWENEEEQMREYEDYEVEALRIRRVRETEAVLGEGGEEQEPYFDLDNEPEERVAGMILPQMELSDPNIYLRELFRVTCRMGTETTRLLKKIIIDKQPLSDEESTLCAAWIKNWTSYMVENHYSILGKMLTLPTGPGGSPQRCSGTMAVIGELWRLRLIVNHHRLKDLMGWRIRDSPFLVRWLLDTPGPQLDTPPIEPDAPSTKNGRIPSIDETDKYETAMRKYREALEEFGRTKKIADTPILALRQSQIRHLVQFITGRIRVVPYAEDIRRLVELVEIKIGIFFCQTLPGAQMDDPRFRTDYQAALNNVVEEIRREASARAQTVREEYQEAVRDAIAQSRAASVGQGVVEGGKFQANRDFWYYCTCYMYPLARIMYYASILPLLRLERFDNVGSYLPDGARDRLEAWIRNLASKQGVKYYERLAEVAEDALAYPGDMEWLAYRHPEESTSIEVVTRKVRGENAYLEQHAAKGLSQTATLDLVNKSWLATEYAVDVFDRYLKTHKGTHWAESYVIRNSYIDDPETSEKWKRTREPFLIQVFSNYWLMFEAKVLPINDVYTAICLWMLLIRKTRDAVRRPANCLNDRTNIADILEMILDNKHGTQYTGDTQKDGEQLEALRRGNGVHTSRIPI